MLQSTLNEEDLDSHYDSDDNALIQIKEATRQLYRWQEEGVKYFFNNNQRVIFECPTGVGKCHGKGTKIIMFDCSIKNVEDIKIGDLLMGDDSNSRKVISTTKGFGNLFNIKQNNGEDYIVNEDHILSLRLNSNLKKGLNKGNIIDISVKNYIKKNKTFKWCSKGYKAPIDFLKQKININPYFLGVWLADGNKTDTGITKQDIEIIIFLKEYAHKLGMKLTQIKDRNTFLNRITHGHNGNNIKNKLYEDLKGYKLFNNKHIPLCYKQNSRNIRLKILAGILDGDGYLFHNCFEIIQKNKKLSNDIVFLARSLGFGVSIKEVTKTIKKLNFSGKYFKISIFGDLSIIPNIVKRKQGNIRKINKNVLNTGISIEPQNKGYYYGFTIEGNNNRYLLKDFTVTHNTTLGIELIKEIWNKNPEAKFLIVVPKNIILESGWYKELYDEGISLKDIGVYYGAVKEFCKITITNMQSIAKLSLKEMNSFSGVILDEVHNYGTERVLTALMDNRISDWKYMIGLTATLERQDNKHYDIMKIFDYNIFRYTPKEALKDSVLNPFEVQEILITLDSETQKDYDKITQEINYIIARSGGYAKLMKSAGRAAALSKMNERKQMVNNYEKKFDFITMICSKHQNEKMIVFNEYNAQTSKVYWQLLDYGLKSCVFHSDIPQKTREKHLIDFKNDKYNIILASRVLDEGWNIPKLSCAVISAGNSTNRQTIQRVGRILRKQKDKLAKLYILTVKDTVEDKYAKAKRKLLEAIAEKYEIINGEEWKVDKNV